MGGLPGSEIDRSQHDYAFWEKRIDALTALLSDKNLFSIDESRRFSESLPPEAYDSIGYYERWTSSLCQALIQRGSITIEELGRKMDEIRQRLELTGDGLDE